MPLARGIATAALISAEVFMLSAALSAARMYVLFLAGISALCAAWCAVWDHSPRDGSHPPPLALDAATELPAATVCSGAQCSVTRSWAKTEREGSVLCAVRPGGYGGGLGTSAGAPSAAEAGELVREPSGGRRGACRAVGKGLTAAALC